MDANPSCTIVIAFRDSVASKFGFENPSVLVSLSMLNVTNETNYHH